MTTSLFGVGTVLNAANSGTIVPQSFVGTAGQTVFNLTAFTYVPNTNSLTVCINGSFQVSGRDYIETSSTSFTLNEGVQAGDFVDVDGIVNTTVTATNAATLVIGGIYTLANYISDQSINVQAYPYLAQGDGVSDDWAALEAAIAYEKIHKVGVVFPGGTYIVSKTLAFLDAALRDLSFVALGKVIIKCTGAGPVATLDSSTPTSRSDNISLIGDWVFQGNAASTYGVYVRGSVKSNLRARVVDVAGPAFRVEWGVLSNYDFTCSSDTDTFLVTPTKCLEVDQSSAGLYTADCVFNCRFEICSNVAIDYIHGGLGNKFMGTCEGVPRGFIQQSTASDAILDRMDFESNTVFDIQAAGRGLTCFGMNSSSPVAAPNIQILSTAAQTKFTDCIYLRQVDVDVAALGVSFSQCALADNASLGITGTGKGNVKIFGCYKVDNSSNISSLYVDQVGASGTWIPAFSTGTGAQGTVTTAVGTYCVIGKLCFVQATMSIAKGTLGAGVLSVTGLPFASRNVANDFQYLHAGEWDNVALGAGYTALVLRIQPGLQTADFIKSGVGVVSASSVLAEYPANITMRFSGVYEIS